MRTNSVTRALAGGILLPLTAGCTAITLFYRELPSTLPESISALPQGLFWLYGLRDMHDYPLQLSMPLAPIFNSLLCVLAPAREALSWPVFYIMASLATLAVALELSGSFLSAAVAAAACGFALGAMEGGRLFTSELLLLALSCSLTAFALMRRAQAERTIWEETSAGLAIGLSLLIKSPLFLLPPALAAWDILSGKLRRGETSWKNLAALFAAAYLPLLPWILTNYRLTDAITVFESGRADQNIISGALGIACAMEGARALAPLDSGKSALLWGISTIVANPLNYLSGLLRRIWMLVEWYPAAVTVLAASGLRLRRNPRMQALLFFIGYYAAMHCLLSIQERYFAPLWPVVLSGAAAILTPRNGQLFSDKARRFAKCIFTGLFVLLAALYLFTSGLLLSYPARAAANGYIITKPGDAAPEALALMSAQALSDGRIARAEDYARRAFLRKPQLGTQLAYLYCLSNKGLDIRPPLRNMYFKRLTPQDTKEQSYLLLADAILRNRKTEIKTALREAYLNWRYADSSFRRVMSLRESEIQKQLKAKNSDFAEVELQKLMMRFPIQRRRILLHGMERAGVSFPIVTPILQAAMFHEAAKLKAPDPKLIMDAKIAFYRSMHPKTAAEFAAWRRQCETNGLDGNSLRQLASYFRQMPQVKSRFTELERLHETHRYKELVAPAERYVADYPFDHVATLFLAVALLNTHDYQRAGLMLDRAAQLPLEAHEIKWLEALRANLKKELSGRR